MSPTVSEHWIGGYDTISGKCDHKRLSMSRKNAKDACFREAGAQEWDSKLEVKLAVPGAGRYVVSRHVSLE